MPSKLPVVVLWARQHTSLSNLSNRRRSGRGRTSIIARLSTESRIWHAREQKNFFISKIIATLPV
jgi:hypothetical protein